MAENIIKAGAQISADVSGRENIDRLAQTIADTSEETSKLNTQAQKLQQEWQQAKQNTALIEHYKALKSSLADNRQEITKTEQQMRLLAQQMQKGETAKQAKQYQDLQNRLTQLNQQKRQLLTTLRDTDKAMSNAGISTRNLANQQQQFANQAKQAELKLAELNEEAQKLQQTAQAKAMLGLDVDEQARKEIEQLDRAFADLKRSGGLSQAELARAAQLHAQKVGEIEKSLQRVKPALSEVASELGNVVSQAGGLAYLANQAMSFETAMASVKKVVDGTPEQYAQLSDSIKQMASELGVMPDALAEIAAAGGQANVALSDLPQFTKMAAQMSVAFKISAEQAGDMAAKIGNVFQIPIKEVEKLMDAVNVLGNTTAAKEAEISDVLMRIGGNAKQFGLAAEEAAALGAAFVSLGKTPEVAGTAINAMLTKLQTSTKQGGDFKNALKDIGLTAEEMARNIQANPQVALTDFLQRLEKLDKQTRSLVLSDLFGAEYSDDLALLSGSLKTYTDALKNATDETQTLNAMQKEANKALEITKGKIDIAKASMAASAATIGETLLPILKFVAEGAAGVGKALGYIAEEFPVLTQLAVIFATGKLAVMAYQTAVKMAGLDSVTAMTKTDASVNKVRATLKGAIIDAKVFATTLREADGGRAKFGVLQNALGNIGGKLTELAGQLAMLSSAAVAGYGFGTALYKEYEIVRDVGDKIGAILSGIHSLWTTGSLDQYRQNFRTYAESEKELARLKRETELAEKQKSETAKQKSEEQAQYIQTLTAYYRQQQKQLNATNQTMRIMENSGETNTAMYARLKEAQKELEQQVAGTRKELNGLHANLDDTSPLIKNRQALEDLGLSVEQMTTGISKSAKESIDNFALAAQAFGHDADSMATLFQSAVSKMDSPEALAELKKSLHEAGAKAGLTVEQIERIASLAPQTGLDLASISKPLGEAEAAANALGISLENALIGTTPAMQSALTQFGAIRSQLDGLAENGVNAGLVLQQSLSKLTETAQTKADIDELKRQIQSLGEAGKLSADEMANAMLAVDAKMAEIADATSPVAQAFKQLGIESRSTTELQLRQAEMALQTIERSGQATGRALEQARSKVQELKNALDPTAQAFERLGIKTKEALAQAAAQQQRDFEAVRKSGQATQEDLQKAFANTANAMLASGDTAQLAWVKSQASAYNYKVAIDETGKASLQSAVQTQVATQQQVQAYNQVSQAAKASAEAQSQASAQAVADTEKATASAESQGRKLSELGQLVHYSLKKTGAYVNLGTASWVNIIKYWQNAYIEVHKTIKKLNEETERGGNIALYLQKAEAMAIHGAKTLDKTTLSNLHQAIDKAREKMAQLAEEARNAKIEAEKSLLSAQGNDEALKRMEQQEKLDVLRKKQADAKKMGNTSAVADYEDAIKLQQKAFEEERRREQQQREQERLEQERLAREQAQEQARQQREAQQQRQTLSTPSTVNLDLDADEMASILQARDENVANQALNNLMKQMQDASYRSR